MRKTDQFVLFLFARKTQTLVPTDFKGHPNIKFLSLPEEVEALFGKALEDTKFIQLAKKFSQTSTDVSVSLHQVVASVVEQIGNFEIEIEGRPRSLKKLGATLGQLRVVVDGTPNLFQSALIKELSNVLVQDCACTFVDNTLISLEYGHIIYIGE